MDEQPFRKFASAFWRNWLSLMSGGPSVPLAILGFYLESPVAKILLWVTAGGCLVLSAYFLWRPERAKVVKLQNRLARISEDRPLSFNGLSIGRYVQPHPPHGDWIIERVELGFENTRAERISWTLAEFFFEYRGTNRTIPLPGWSREVLSPCTRVIGLRL